MTDQFLTITTVNQTLWQEYAEKTTKTWQFDHRIYWEEDRPEPRSDIWQQWREFHKTRQPEPDFQHTWSRFSHKVERQLQALCDPEIRREYRYLIWLDADVVEQQSLTLEFYQQIQPQGEFLTYLGRGRQYPETGFICYDFEHPDLERFTVHLRGEYLGDRLFQLEQFHDAYVWNHVCEREQISRRSIGPNSPGEAFLRSPLRDYLLHLKGPRKTNIHRAKNTEELMQKPPKKPR